MVGVVIVSHSRLLAEGVVDLCRMVAAKSPIVAAGGLEDGDYGTSYTRIARAIESVRGDEGVVVLADMGSSVLTTEIVVEDLGYKDVVILDTPLVEGAFAAAVTSMIGGTIEDIRKEAAAARSLPKVH